MINFLLGLEKKYLIYFGLAIHLIAVFFTEGFHRPDEHLGIFRFAAFKLGTFPVEELSWEYPAQIRPWLHPYMFVTLIKFLNFFGIDNPFTYAFFFRLVSSLTAFFALIKFIDIYSRDIKDSIHQKILYLCATLLWFLPFFHARTTAENWGGTFFLLALCLLYPLFNNKETKLRASFAAGLLMGLAFIFRFQMGVMILFFMLWQLLFERQTISSLATQTLGIITLVAFSTYIDFIGYGNWTFTPYNYLYHNLVLGRASGFGVSAWYYYITKTFSKSAPPLSLFILGTFFLYWFKNKSSLFTWLTLPFLLVHSYLGHKELRFVFVLGLFLPILLIEVYDYLKDKNLAQKKWFIIILNLALVQNMLLLFVSSLKPAYGPISLYHFFYDRHQNEQTYPSELITLGLFRDQLKFYLPSPIKQIREENRDKIKPIIQEQNEPKWFLTDKFKDKSMFESFSQCGLLYSSYPTWLFNHNYFGWMKRSKIWSVYRCAPQ